MSDNVMRMILEAHRAEVNSLETRATNAEFHSSYQDNEIARLKAQVSSSNSSFNAVRQQRDDANEKVAKLESVIETLKIELQNERAAHTAAKKRTARKAMS